MARRGGRALPARALAALLVAACAQTSPAPSPELCLAEFEELDRLQRFYPATTFDRVDDLRRQSPRIARQVATIRRADCTTGMNDLAGAELLMIELAGRRIADSGAAIRPTALQVGIVTGFAAEIQAASLFGNLGYRYRSQGVEGLGRQVFVGPFRSQGALDEAMAIARRAGFIAPYPSKYTRF